MIDLSAEAILRPRHLEAAEGWGCQMSKCERPQMILDCGTAVTDTRHVAALPTASEILVTLEAPQELGLPPPGLAERQALRRGHRDGGGRAVDLGGPAPGAPRPVGMAPVGALHNLVLVRDVRDDPRLRRPRPPVTDHHGRVPLDPCRLRPLHRRALESGAEIVFARRRDFHGQHYRVLLPDRRTGLKARFLHVPRELTVERALLLGGVPT